MFGSRTARAWKAGTGEPERTGGSNRSINCLKTRRLLSYQGPLSLFSRNFGAGCWKSNCNRVRHISESMNSQGKMRSKAVLMLLTNAYDPDPRVRQEALALIGMGCRVRLLAWDRDLKAPATALMEGVEVERVYLSSAHGRGTTQIFFYACLYLKMLWRGLRTPFDVVHCHDLDR